jgi:hypothetical protein
MLGKSDGSLDAYRENPMINRMPVANSRMSSDPRPIFHSNAFRLVGREDRWRRLARRQAASFWRAVALFGLIANTCLRHCRAWWRV